LAPTAAAADALSTAFYLLGSEAAKKYTAAHPDVGVVIVNRHAGAESPELLAFGLGEHDFAATSRVVN
jgi:thiamine biosynthesis lipoprotein